MSFIRPRVSLQALLKRFALICLPIVIVLSIALLLIAQNEDQNQLETRKDRENNEIRIFQVLVEKNFEAVDSDLRVIAKLPSLRRYLDSHSPAQRNELDNFFLALSKEKRRYDQVRYIDASGQEVIRINYNNGNPAILPHEQLQNKSRRYFFNDAFKLNQGEVYVSPLDLNVEENRLEIPYKPTIRFGTPVFDSAGRKKGILLFNYYGNDLLQNFRKIMSGGDHSSMLLNRDGYWLDSRNHADEWGFMLGKKERTFGHDFDNEWRTISIGEEGTLLTEKGLFIYSTVHPLLLRQHSSTGSDTAVGARKQVIEFPEYYWKIVSFTPRDVLSGARFFNQAATRMVIVYIYLVLALGSWLIAFITLRRKLGEEALDQSEEKLRGLYELSPLGIALTDMQGNYIEFNESFRGICGYTEQELKSLDYWTLTPRKYEADEARQLDSLANTGHYGPYEKEYIRKDGSLVPLQLNGMLLTGSDGQKYIWSIVQDITGRKQAENNQRIAATAFESQESLMITDADGVILRVNKAFTETTGYPAEEVVGQTPRLLKSGRHDAEFYREMWETINRTGTWQGEIWDRRKNGEIYPKWLSISAVKGDDGVVTHYVGSHIDITERKATEEKILHLAFYDHLTNLPNRLLLLDRLKQALSSSTRSRRSGLLLFIDLDNFKNLNDTLGHDIGDLLLQQVTQRLESCIREGDTVARLGGDEFVVMLLDLSGQSIEAAAQTETIGEKILAALDQPYQLGSYVHRCTASIGATLFKDHQQTPEELMKQADIAMYQAKKAGRNTLRFFDPEMQTSITARVSLEEELRKAIEKQQFQLYYQIQVDRSSRPLGAEALIRWVHPERGMVSPAHFIPLAEETGLILPIGQWVLETACAQIKVWQQDAQACDLVLAVNVSAKQFHQADFVAQVQTTMQRHAINPMRLKLELTESLLLKNIEDTIATMNALNEVGVQLSLDDFGTGYSSLQYLKRLPLDQLKIDQSFVRDISIDSSDKTIIRTIIAMAQNLNLDVIAEGVETEEQRQFLMSNSCTHFQGYLFGRPVPIEQFDALLKQG
jgi:diguanylate cyclase (GGDEF)-like protein/PAS domain S-box-containing protein